VSKLRFGVLSTAKIGTVKVIPAMQQGKHTEVTAIASRNLETAQATAKQLGIAKAYGSYEELLADPDVDAIYNPMPNHLHVPWAIKALEAGKHVICEKPIGLNSQEAEQLLAAAKKHPQLKIMEAFMYRHHPQWQAAKHAVQSGELGELRTIQSFFSYHNRDGQNIRNNPDLGGGGLMDIGCYCISLSRFIFGAEPTRVIGSVEYDPEFKTDRIASAMMEFAGKDSSSPNTATFTCSTQLVPYQRVNIFGTEGRFEIEIPFNAPPDKPCKVWQQRGDKVSKKTFEICNQYTIQGDLFALAVLNNTPVPTPLEDALGNMRVIEAIVRSGKTGGWVNCWQLLAASSSEG
jgi:predicted dehydrogenase